MPPDLIAKMTSVANWPFQEVVRHSRSFVDEKPLQDEESLKEDVIIKGDTTLVVGSTDLFDEFGQIRLIPVRRRHFSYETILTSPSDAESRS